MSTVIDEQQRKEALKEVRAQRAGYIKAAAAAAKRQKEELRLVTERLAQGPATPPEVARDTGLGPERAMWLLSAMRKYGQVQEDAKNGDYFAYALVPQDSPDCD